MPSSTSAWAVIVAAGEGRRFGTTVPKQFTSLAGQPLVLWTLAPFRDHPAIDGVTLVVPPGYVERPPPWLRRLDEQGVAVVAGGEQRSDSVRLGLAAVPTDMKLVAVHDGARPLISEDVISRVLERAGPERGAIAARRVTDSLKEADEAGQIERSLSRARLWRAETPQVFPLKLLLEVHQRAAAEGVHASDCAALCERYGVAAVLVEVEEPNPKITSPDDLRWAEAWLRMRGKVLVERHEG